MFLFKDGLFLIIYRPFFNFSKNLLVLTRWNTKIVMGCVRHLNVRIGEHIGTSPLPKKQVKPKNSSIADYLLFYNHSGSYDNFSILECENKMFPLELKESLLIM